ncbi:hypothetical protein Pla123a_31880 [Posidoniimonas polymericola]|uniref:Carboxypeptidase regulatory-like domain-containing protein n=1 Tax=Posidoniimonas polymericola TaxID=2528002 RepID=A0A5C5YLP8_9BACT|nr:carboxypeptidase-like regulatory domain-containing protein [Posidoniimonas polymericola]TWT75678.1 hypothetical protein Pla123a_31880 [Posidoniimonas polymericola]
MSRINQLFALCLCALAALTQVGCGSYDATVSGSVSLDGEPLKSGTISFFPVADGPTAYARIEPTGQYELRTGREAGLAPGEYQVTVVAREQRELAANDAGGPPPPGKQLTPNHYRDRKTSGLAYTIEPGHNQIDLDLTTAQPGG